MNVMLLIVLSFPFFKKSAVSTDAYLRCQEYLAAKKYEEAGALSDSLLGEGYRDREVLYVLMYSLYKRAMWDSIVNLSPLVRKFRIPEKTDEFADCMFMIGVAYYKKHNVAFSVYYIVSSAISEKSKKRAASFLKNYTGITFLPKKFDIHWLYQNLPVGILFMQGVPQNVESDVFNGFVLGLGGITQYVRISKMKDIKNSSLVVGPMLSKNVNGVLKLFSGMFEPAVFPLCEDIRIGIFQPLYPLNARYSLELEKGLELFTDKLGYINYAIYYDQNDPVALSGKKFIEKKLAQKGLYVVEEKSFTKDSLNMLAEIDSTTGDNWDVVFVLGRRDFALTLATTFRREVEELPVFVYSDFKWKVIQGGYVGLNGIIFAGYFQGERKMLDLLSEKQRFFDKYNAQFGTYPSAFAERGYDVGKLVGKIVQSVDTLNRKNVWNYLYNAGVFEGISGYFVFRDDLSLIKVYTFKNGRIMEYKEE